MGSNGEESGDEALRGPDIPDEEEITSIIAEVSLKPSEHQRIKDLVNGKQLGAIKGHDRRYLVAGAGGESGASTRRKTVSDLLDTRSDPPAVAFRLEDFGLTPEEIKLWARIFDILCGMATHVVGVIEDFDGGYVWELGLLFAPEYREKVWILKRRYPDGEEERAQYDNGMAISYIELLLTGDRCLEWETVEALRDAVREIP